jgi:hypothetical protein
MGDDNKETYHEESKSETQTKTDDFGNPQKDAAGEPVKETKTETEGHVDKSSDSDDNDSKDDD